MIRFFPEFDYMAISEAIEKIIGLRPSMVEFNRCFQMRRGATPYICFPTGKVAMLYWGVATDHGQTFMVCPKGTKGVLKLWETMNI